MAATSANGVEVTATKDDKGENFPVASVLIAPRHRATVLAFYTFARTADDIADSPDLSPEEKVRRLDLFEATLLGQSDEVASARPLREALARTGVTPRHAQDLLVAFRMDATKLRYADFDELLHYCRYSAAPVGRYVLDVHGEAETTWPANDALCSALQIINHLQDCGKDYRLIDRVYVPQDMLAKHGARTEDLGADAATPALRACLGELAHRNAALVAHGEAFSPQVRDWRLRLETAIIGRLARKLNGWLEVRDPLAETVHLSKVGALWQALLGAGGSLLTPRAPAPRASLDRA
jgi:squalene synthase HpnC